jgi:signal transduction histidine kinase
VRSLDALNALRTRRPVAFEVGTGIAGGVLVLGVSLSQWGADADSVFRAGSLAIWLGTLVWFVARRRRVADERARRALDAQRLLLARELHDTVAGQVSVVGIQAAAARRVMQTRPDEAAVALERIEAAARAANADLRRMLEALRGRDELIGAGADSGLARLEDLVASVEIGPARVALAIAPGVRPVTDVAVDRAAFRIVQEALTNARRHAGDVPIRVDVRRDGGVLLVDVVNGPGTSTVEEAGGTGLGLVGIRERAALLGGSADAGPTLDGGFAVRVRLPFRGGS